MSKDKYKFLLKGLPELFGKLKKDSYICRSYLYKDGKTTKKLKKY